MFLFCFYFYDKIHILQTFWYLKKRIVCYFFVKETI